VGRSLSIEAFGAGSTVKKKKKRKVKKKTKRKREPNSDVPVVLAY